MTAAAALTAGSTLSHHLSPSPPLHGLPSVRLLTTRILWPVLTHSVLHGHFTQRGVAPAAATLHIMEKLPTLSNTAQLKIMRLVKAGMSMDDALKQASELEAEEQEVRNTASSKERSMTLTNHSIRRKPDGHALTPSPQKDSNNNEEPELSAAEINRQTLAVVTQMVKDGKVTAEEAKRHARQLANIKVRKAGDAQRILLMNMVKDGNISIEEAVSHAKGMGVDVDSKQNKGLDEAEGPWLMCVFFVLPSYVLDVGRLLYQEDSSESQGWHWIGPVLFVLT
jgi:hypothetical protein